MSDYIEMEFCRLPNTPYGFDAEKFKAGDMKQIDLYGKSKHPNMDAILTYDQVASGEYNYARFVPKDCCYIDFDEPEEAEAMKRIIIRSGVKCLMLKTQHGYHFLFRNPTFYEKQMTNATNWFGFKFDTKSGNDGARAVQNMRVCGMDRPEVCSWDPTTVVIPEKMNTDSLDVLPYWLWGHLKDDELHKEGKPGESIYHLDDTPFTQLMKMGDGGRHDKIFSKCGLFALSNGFTKEDFRAIIQSIHDEFLVKIGTPMSKSDLFSDLDDRWEEYIVTLKKYGWDYDEKKRKWLKAGSKKEDKIDERRAAEWLYTQYDFYGNNRKVDGTFDGLLYKNIDGEYDYKRDVTVFREALKEHSDQNFKDIFFKEVEVQLMQMCAANGKEVHRNDKFVIAKNKVLSCVVPDVYDFSWLGTRPPTDVILPWNWYSEEWVEEHEEDLGNLINKFMKQLSRDALGTPQPTVEQWLWVIAGACMIPSNQLQKIVILSGGGRNGKSLYTSLIRLCLGEDMFNESKIFDTSPQDSFWGAELDKGILCVIDDLPRLYNRDSFSYIKGAITGTDSVVINEKFKPKRKLSVLPQIVACTNFEFELYDKSEGMKRRVLILPTEYEVPLEMKDTELQHKLVLNTTDLREIAEYKMSEDAFSTKGEKVMNMYTKEKGVLDSLDHGSLAWFANKARYMYFKWLFKDLKLGATEGMKERFDSTFSGGFDAELIDFIKWYIETHDYGAWTRDFYADYVDWHNEMATGETLMREKQFGMKLSKAINACNDAGYKIEMRKRMNDKHMSLNYIYIGKELDELLEKGK